MATYIILTKLAPDAFKDPAEFPAIAKTVADKIRTDCSQATWKESYMVTGQYDVLDVVEAPDLAVVERACMIIRGYGHGTTETMVATPWPQFIESLTAGKTAATIGTA